MSSVAIDTASPDETRAVGRRLAGLLQPGDVVLLSGRLGTGKTLFASGVADGLGIDEPVVSPSFVLAKTYDGFLPLVHADAYRLGSTAEFDDLGLSAEAGDGVLLIEWGEAVAAQVSPDHLEVHIETTGDTARRLVFVPMGTWTQRPLQELDT